MQDVPIQLPRATRTQKADVAISVPAGAGRETVLDIFRGAVLYNAPSMASALSDLDARIDESRYMLDLGDDWDDEGAPGYKLETWERATKFVRATAVAFMRLTGRVAPAPRFSHGPESSVDILWEAGGRKLLINVPEDVEQKADFYGHGPNREAPIKGLLDPASPKTWLLMWLTE